MKKTYTLFLIIVPLFLSLIGCKGSGDTQEMSTDEILKVLNVKIHKHPKDDQLYYDRAKVYMQLNRVNEAISDLAHAVALNDKEPSYFILLGDAYLSNGDPSNSYKNLQRALDLDPDNQEAVLKLGEIAYYSRDFDRAMEHLSKVTAKDPQNRIALFMKGFIYKETGDTSNAITLLRKVCDLYPDYEPAFEELGVIYSELDDPLALEYLNTALRLEPQNTNAIYNLAIYYQSHNKVENAEELYKQILDINANHKDAWHNRGYIQLFTYGDYEAAVDHLTHAIQCDSTFIEAWTNRGCAYELLGRNKEALDDFRQALSLDHTFQPAIDGIKRVS